MVVLLWSQDFSLLLVGKSRLPLQVEIIDERKGLLEQSLFDASEFLAPVQLAEAEYRVNVKIAGGLIGEPARVAASEQAASPMVYSDLLSFLHQESRRVGGSRLSVEGFIGKAPVPGGVKNLEEAEKHVQQGLESLCRRKKIKIHKKRGDRYLFRRWDIEVV